MQSKAKTDGRRQSFSTVATDSKASPQHQKKQKALRQKETASIDVMKCSISNDRYGASPRRSPLSMKKNISAHQEDSSLPTLSLRSQTLDVPSLTSLVETITNSNIIEEDEDMLTICQRTEAITGSFALENNCKHGYDEHSVPLETEDNRDKKNYSINGYSETSMAMIIDSEGDKERQDSGKFESTDTILSPCSPTNEYVRKAFCPERMPRRSSMKGSAELFSPSSVSRRNSIGITERFEVILPGQSEPVQRRRSISFDNRVNVQKIEPVRLLAADPQSLWYQEIEYDVIKLKTLALLDQVDHSSGQMNGKRYCTRGLEKFMEPESTEVKKHQAWDCVLNEQFLQRKDGEFDAQTLADIYRYSTKRSQNEASKRARQDAEEAQAILETTFSTLSMSSNER